MADITYGDTSATSPKQQYVNSRFYKPTSTDAGYDSNNPNLVYNSSGQGLNYDQYITEGGNAQFSNVSPGAVPKPSPIEGAKTSYLDSFNPSSALQSARAAYLDSFTDPGVNTAKQKYLDFVTNTKLGQNKLEGQGRGIPLELVRGEQAKLGQQSELEASRLQGDVNIAQDAATLAQNKAKTGLDFATTDFGMGQDKTKTNLGFAQDDQTASKANLDFNIKNKITQPYYVSGNHIINAATGQPEYENDNGTIINLGNGYRYHDKDELFKDAGINSWDQIQKDIGANPLDKLLSPTEAKTLGVPYGTTQAQAATLKITPTSATAKKGSSGSSKSSPTSTPGPTTKGMDSYVKGIIALHPGIGTVGGRNNIPNGAQWDAAAAAIDKKFGAGTATLYDDLLKKAYATKGSGRSI